MRTSLLIKLSLVGFILAWSGCGPSPESGPQAASTSGAAASAGSSAAGAPTAETQSGARPLNAWVVRSPEGRESLLFGSFHVGVDLATALPPPHDRRIADARVVMLELDPAAMDPAQIAPLTVLPEGERLSSLIGQTLFDALVARVGAPAERLDRMRPWVAMSIVMVQELTPDPGTESAPEEETPPPQLDAQVAARAASLGTPVHGLETLAEQAGLMDAIPLEAHVAYLESVLFESPEPTTEPQDSSSVTELRDAYVRGDLQEMERQVLDPAQMQQAPDFYERLFFARNETWLRKLAPGLEQGGVFCTVGIGHLIGPRGMLSGLEEAGYSVERLVE